MRNMYDAVVNYEEEMETLRDIFGVDNDLDLNNESCIDNFEESREEENY